ncbi:GDSL-type esterase/lipase family protein [Sphingomonas sp.]|uniref:GDSL-type esterase/lipase family protein n=1 Tax=Sphingomonas sp. TaxID=28214 RepID=UPI003B3A4C8C
MRQAIAAAQIRLIEARGKKAARPDVVFLGDSITEFWLEADPWMFWPRRRNLGVSGSTTADMLIRFERDVVPLQPKILHVMGGTNDLWYGAPGPEASDSIANLVRIAERSKQLGISLILAAPPPISATAESLFASPHLYPVLVEALQRYGAAHDLVYVDYGDSLRDEHGGLRPRYTTDGVHLTRAGYHAMRQQTKQALRQLGA